MIIDHLTQDAWYQSGIPNDHHTEIQVLQFRYSNSDTQTLQFRHSNFDTLWTICMFKVYRKFTFVENFFRTRYKSDVCIRVHNQCCSVRLPAGRVRSPLQNRTFRKRSGVGKCAFSCADLYRESVLTVCVWYKNCKLWSLGSEKSFAMKVNVQLFECREIVLERRHLNVKRLPCFLTQNDQWNRWIQCQTSTA